MPPVLSLVLDDGADRVVRGHVLHRPREFRLVEDLGAAIRFRAAGEERVEATILKAPVQLRHEQGIWSAFVPDVEAKPQVRVLLQDVLPPLAERVVLVKVSTVKFKVRVREG